MPDNPFGEEIFPNVQSNGSDGGGMAYNTKPSIHCERETFFLQN